MQIPGHIDVVAGIVPVDLSAAANDGDWVNAQAAEAVTVLFFAAAGTAGQDPVFTLQQAQDNAGTGAKDLNFTKISHKAGTLTAVPNWTEVEQTAANTYTNATHAEVQKIYAVTIQTREMDASGGFNHLRVQIPDVGAAAQLGCALYLLHQKYVEAPGDEPSPL